MGTLAKNLNQELCCCDMMKRICDMWLADAKNMLYWQKSILFVLFAKQSHNATLVCCQQSRCVIVVLWPNAMPDVEGDHHLWSHRQCGITLHGCYICPTEQSSWTLLMLSSSIMFSCQAWVASCSHELPHVQSCSHTKQSSCQAWVALNENVEVYIGKHITFLQDCPCGHDFFI